MKLVEQDDELYILARSGARRDKEQAMRRRRLKKLIKRLHELRQQKLTRDQLLIKISTIEDDKSGTDKLNKISQPVEENDRSYRGFNFFDPDDEELFEALAEESSTSVASETCANA